jgi:hypothetical protein
MKRALANRYNRVKQEPYLLPTREPAVHRTLKDLELTDERTDSFHRVVAACSTHPGGLRRWRRLFPTRAAERWWKFNAIDTGSD